MIGYFIILLLLVKLRARWGWWVGFVVVAALDIMPAFLTLSVLPH